MYRKSRHSSPRRSSSTQFSIPALVFLSTLLLFSFPLAAQTDGGGELVRTRDVSQGSLLLRTEVNGLYLPAPAVETKVDIRVTGLIARAEVTQSFHNPADAWVEGIYVFPLPETAAVDTLRMRVGKRLIEGEIHERGEAKRIYQKAKSQGKKASLVEQERPNLFTTSVANLGPGETVEVTIGYQQELHFDGGRFSLRFPMAITERFNPSPERVPDACRITPPQSWDPVGESIFGGAPETEAAEKSAPPRNPVYLTIELDSGIEVAHLKSPSHAPLVERKGAGRYKLSLGPVPADRDFLLDWEWTPGSLPRAALFEQDFEFEGAQERYALLMVTPPIGNDDFLRLPRETVFVIDTSGSMGGASIDQAREALKEALDQLRPEDHFNVIRFSGSPSKLYDESRPASSSYLREAVDWVDGLYAMGGTNIREALEAALQDQDVDRGLRQVIFLTDGAVGNENELMSYIYSNLGRSRLFTVGIGSAPNSHFMRQAADFGRGTFTYIADTSQVAEKMDDLFAKIESPVLRDLEVWWDDPLAESWPRRPGDLYLGEPLMLAVRLEHPDGGVKISGLLGDEPWEESFSLEGGELASGIDRLWARRKIDSFLKRRVRGEQQESEVRALVLETALKHHLVTKYTSLVAVDRTPTAPADVPVHKASVPLRVPAGRQPPAGVLPQTGTTAALRLVLGAILFGLGTALLLTERRA